MLIMMQLHWEYRLYCVITAIYIPILSGAVLVFTGLRIRATLRRRRDLRIRLHQNTPNIVNDRRPAVISSRWQSYIAGGSRTLKILTFTSVAYFLLWSPYVALVVVQSIVGSFKPPSGVEFAVMWLANANSAVNVFIYSSTNKQFRRECVLLASRLCCSRRSWLWQSKWCLMEPPSPSCLRAVPDSPGCFLLGWWIQEVDVVVKLVLAGSSHAV